MKLIFFPFVFLFILINCGQNKVMTSDEEGGSGSQTTNTISGKVVDSTGTPVSGAKVNLVASNHNTALFGSLPDSAVQYTNEEGSFAFQGFEMDVYTIEAFAYSQGTGLIVDSLNHSGGITELEELSLQPLSVVNLPTSGLQLQNNDIIYIPGTTILVVVDSSMLYGQYVSIDSIPVGKYNNIGLVRDDEVQEVRFPLQIVVDSIIPVGPYFLWKHSGILNIDINQTNSVISESLHDFPLLLRLTEKNFNFEEAQFGGQDLRIVKKNEVPVVFEIENWDKENKTATIWINIDTLFNNNFNSLLAIYWGNKISDNIEQNGFVFDSANGYLGVWHLNQNPMNGIAHSVRDASPNQNHLTPFGNYFDSNYVSGISGPAILFDGKEDYLNTVADYIGDFSVSMWVKTLSINQNEYSSVFSNHGHPTDSNFQIDVSPSPNKYRAYMGVGKNPDSSLVTHFGDSQMEFQYITMTVKESNLQLYLNGFPTNNNILQKEMVFTLFKIGENRGSDQHFHGIIDEVRVSRISRSSDWIKVSYLNQLANSTLVNFQINQ